MNYKQVLSQQRYSEAKEEYESLRNQSYFFAAAGFLSSGLCYRLAGCPSYVLRNTLASPSPSNSTQIKREFFITPELQNQTQINNIRDGLKTLKFNCYGCCDLTRLRNSFMPIEDFKLLRFGLASLGFASLTIALTVYFTKVEPAYQHKKFAKTEWINPTN